MLASHVHVMCCLAACFLPGLNMWLAPSCLLATLKLCELHTCLKFLHGKEMTLLNGKESVIQLTTYLILISNFCPFLLTLLLMFPLSFITLSSSWSTSFISETRKKNSERKRERKREKSVRKIHEKFRKKNKRREVSLDDPLSPYSDFSQWVLVWLRAEYLVSWSSESCSSAFGFDR